MGICRNCSRSDQIVSHAIGFCVDCIRADFERVWPEIEEVHRQSRRAYGLPESPPRAAKGLSCPLCVQQCRIAEGERGYCGLREVAGGRIRGGRPHEGNLSYYYDPLPTNCVADFVCPGGTGSGHPLYTFSKGPEYGFQNLAVFYHACSFNCLYCQNYHFKDKTYELSSIPAKQLAAAVDSRTTCICYFGGDPAPQVLHALKTSILARGKAGQGILRICWETNGAVQAPFLGKMAELSLHSGGCIKVDLKAWDEGLHRALCGVTNRMTLENFRSLAEWAGRRPDPPFLVASTLLVPGYVDEMEVSRIARFICGLNPKIPYRLLGFYPHFYISDLPNTSKEHAVRCKAAAEAAGLQNVHLGNVNLLGDAYQTG